MKPAPLLSLVTGTYNRKVEFERLVLSIVRETRVPWELVVADASTEPYGFSLPDEVQIIEERPRLGHSRGYNRAFRDCRGTWVLWLNDDAEVCEGYDVEAIQFMEEHPQIGLGALHYSENGGPFHVNSAWGTIYANFGIFRRELGERVGFFDEDLTMYGADNSIALKILLEGLGVADIPGARILHHSVNDAIRQENQKYRLRDNQTLTAKYMPLKQSWRQSFWLNFVDNGTRPWIHGKTPAA